MRWVLRNKKEVQHTCSKVVFHRYAFSLSEAKEYYDTFADKDDEEDLQRLLKCRGVTGRLTDL